MSHDHWREYHTRWSKLRPPLRPSREVAAAVRALVAERPGQVLLLGVTPELADVAPDVTAVDRSEGMLRAVWPGDGPWRHAVQGDWRALPFESASFTCVVGDGSLNVGSYEGTQRKIWEELRRVVRPGGRVVCRVFARPEDAGTVAHAFERARARRVRTFHAFKWELAMARVAELGTPDIAVEEIRETFERGCGGRRDFAEASGFSVTDVETIDVYRGSSEVYCFPTEREFLARVPEGAAADFTRVSGYELSERCPLLVVDLPPGAR